MMNEEKEDALERAREHLEDADAQAAFAGIRAWLSWPQTFDSSGDWSESWNVFGDIADEIIGEELGDLVRSVAEQPTKVEGLYELGYQLIEVGLPDLAASVLARANEVEPGHENVVGELVHALEISGFNAAAAQILHDAPELVDRSFMMRYLLAFNSMMAGDGDTPRELLPDMIAEGDEESFMYRRIKRFVARHDQITGVSALDDSDLRGWHFVTNGAILLHLSPYGLDDAMRGRYAFVQDSVSTCREAIERLRKVLDAWGAATETIWALPDRDSQILALATAEILKIDLKNWPEDGTSEPGLIVAYDLDNIDARYLEQVYENRAGQILWSHAACWTPTPPFSADIHSFLYQHNVAPWGARMSFDPESDEVVQVAPDNRDIHAVAQDIFHASLEADQLDDIAELEALAQTAALLEEDLGPSALAEGLGRSIFWECSPVKSNRFQ